MGFLINSSSIIMYNKTQNIYITANWSIISCDLDVAANDRQIAATYDPVQFFTSTKNSINGDILSPLLSDYKLSAATQTSYHD
jgi:hypothetical protein